MSYIKSIASGCITALIAWAIFTLADAIDEYVIDADSCIGMILVVAMPIIMLIGYIINYIKHKPKIRYQLVKLVGYVIMFSLTWLCIYNKLEDNDYIVKQTSRSSWLDLNSIEYIFYSFSAFFGYLAMCIIFRIVYIIIKKLKSKREKVETIPD